MGSWLPSDFGLGSEMSVSGLAAVAVGPTHLTKVASTTLAVGCVGFS